MTIRRRDEAPSITVDGLVRHTSHLGSEELAELAGGHDDVSKIEPSFAGAAASVGALLAAAGVEPAGRFVTVASDDGHYSASIPLETLSEAGLMIYQVEGSPLPRESGGPFRLIVPDGKTLCWNVKSVVSLTVTAEAVPDSVPANPPH